MGRRSAPAQGPFLQTLNVGCMLVAGGFVSMLVGGVVLIVLELGSYVLGRGQ